MKDEYFKPFKVKTLRDFLSHNGRRTIKADTQAFGVMTPDNSVHLAETEEQCAGSVIVPFAQDVVEAVDFERTQ